MTPVVPLVALAICVEVGATLSLKMATMRGPRWLAVALLGYVSAFAALTGALAEGAPLGIIYGIWAACGVAATAVASRWLFNERLSPLSMTGIALIAVGVLIIELGATP
jgi:small multidrug resistance pump